MPKPSVLVVCPTSRDLHYLTSKKIRKRFRVPSLGDDIENPGHFDAATFLKAALQQLKKTRLPDGIVGNDDYPAALLATYLTQTLHKPGASAASVFHCQHKYYSRLEQKAAVPEATPDFFLVPLNRKWKREDIPLRFPFFVKPVKGYLSILSRKIRSWKEFQAIVREAQKRLHPFIRPFDTLIQMSGLQDRFPIGGNFLIAEQLLKGSQVTLEGYVFRGEVKLIGIVDSIFFPNTLSFKRFQYPSRLPAKVQSKMFAIAKRFLKRIEFDNAFFNIEFIYHPRKKMIHILEVNGRMACQFAGMMEAVHGTNPYEVLLDLAVGKKPAFHSGRGRARVAASFVLRLFEDKKVERVPSEAELLELRREIPEAHVEVLVQAGKRLSEHFQQDDESYRYALVNLSAKNERQLFLKFRECQKFLHFVFSPEKSISKKAKN